MLPEQRKLITQNQKVLYSFRKKGTNLPKRELVTLAKTVGISFQTLKNSLMDLQRNNIILDYKDFLINPQFAYFVGFYVTDDEIEVELLDFSLEPVLEKVMPNFVRKIKYKSDFEAIKLMENIINDISKNVKVEAISIIFNKFFNYQTGFAYSENGSGLEIYDLSVTLKNSKAILPPALHNVFVGDTVLAYTLYLREKVFESQSIVYYDLDQNAVCYIMNNILQKSTNPVSGMIFPRFTHEQSEFFEKLKNVSDDSYADMINSNINKFDFILPAYLQLKSIFNPEHFVFGGKIPRPPLLELISKNIFCNYDEITSTLFVESSHSQIFDIVNMGVHLSRGAGIFAAYSFFDWDLRW